MPTTYPFSIDHLTRDERGHWTATLNIYGDVRAVDRSQGSWRYTPPVLGGPWQGLELIYATALQERVRRLERAERREGAE